EIAVAPGVGDLNRGLVLLSHQAFELGGGDVSTLRLLVRQRFHLDCLLPHLGHPFPLHAASRVVSCSTNALKAASISWTAVNSANAERPKLLRLFTPGTQ